MEVDALYGRQDYDYTSIRFFSPSTGNFYSSQKHAVDQFDSPFLVKYEFQSRMHFQAFVGAGGSVLYARDNVLQGVLREASPAGPQPYFSPINGSALPTMTTVSGGAVVAVGAAHAVGRFRMSAEFRYTRILNNAVKLPALNSNFNQANVLFGVMF